MAENVYKFECSVREIEVADDGKRSMGQQLADFSIEYGDEGDAMNLLRAAVALHLREFGGFTVEPRNA